MSKISQEEAHKKCTRKTYLEHESATKCVMNDIKLFVFALLELFILTGILRFFYSQETIPTIPQIIGLLITFGIMALMLKLTIKALKKGNSTPHCRNCSC